MGTYFQEVNREVAVRNIHMSSFGRKGTLFVDEGTNCWYTSPVYF